MNLRKASARGIVSAPVFAGLSAGLAAGLAAGLVAGLVAGLAGCTSESAREREQPAEARRKVADEDQDVQAKGVQAQEVQAKDAQAKEVLAKEVLAQGGAGSRKCGLTKCRLRKAPAKRTAPSCSGSKRSWTRPRRSVRTTCMRIPAGKRVMP